MRGIVPGDHLAYIYRSRSENRWVVYKVRPRLKRSISDQKHGGPVGSLQVAIAYRNDHLDEAAPDVEGVRYEQVMDRETLASIVSGIHRVDTSQGEHFQAQWKEDGTEKCRKRSIAYHGEKEALRQVAQLRYDAKESSVEGLSWQAFWEEAKHIFL